MKVTLVLFLDIYEENTFASVFSLNKFQLISEIRSLSADCLPSRIKASACRVSARQYFGWSVAYFFHQVKNLKDKLVSNMVRDETCSSFF